MPLTALPRTPIDETSCVARRDLTCVESDGSELSVRILVGRPYETGHGSWACPVETRGLHDDHPDIIGSDSLQAICLALSLVRMLLEYFIQDGGKILDPVDRSEVSPDGLAATFGGVGRPVDKPSD
jgi:hypothetical protein